MDIYVRNAAMQRVALVERYRSLRTMEQLHTEGSWVLELEGWSPIVALMRQPGSGIDVRDDYGKAIFSGPCTVEQVRSSGTDVSITYSGPDDNAWLSRRLALPEPLVADPSTWSTSHDIHQGPLTTALRELVDVQLGPGALVERRIPTLEIDADDPAAGTTEWDVEGRLFSVLAIIHDASLGTDVVSWVRQVGTKLVFNSQLGTTREGVLFSPDLGGLDFEFQRSAPGATAVYVAGQGEQETRPIRVVDEDEFPLPPEWPWRFEKLLDARSEVSQLELFYAGEKFLIEEAATRTLRMNASDAGWVPRQDFDIGDRVSVMVDGEHWLEKVTAIEVSYAPDGRQESVVTIGSPETLGPRGLFEANRKLGARITNVEAQ